MKHAIKVFNRLIVLGSSVPAVAPATPPRLPHFLVGLCGGRRRFCAAGSHRLVQPLIRRFPTSSVVTPAEQNEPRPVSEVPRLENSRMTEKLEAVTNIALIALVCVVGYHFLPARSTSENPPPASVQVGDRLPRLAAYDWKSHDRTLILALKNGCRFCEESFPFYRRLAELEKSNQTDAHVIAVFPDDPAAVRQHLEAQRLAVEALAGVELNQVNVAGTPTLILVDRQGRASRVWIGALEAAEEAEVVTALKRTRVLNASDEDKN